MAEENKSMKVVSLHHQMTTVKDMDEAIHLYQDVLGLRLISRLIVPNDVIRPAEGKGGTKEVFADGIDHVWEIACLDSYAGGCPIELCHPLYPEVAVNNTDYGFTGHTERGLAVEDIDAWYDWIVECGYRPQSKPWEAGMGHMTFCFYDKEGNVIQLYEDPEHPAIPKWPNMPLPAVDLRSPEQRQWAEDTYK